MADYLRHGGHKTPFWHAKLYVASLHHTRRDQVRVSDSLSISASVCMHLLVDATGSQMLREAAIAAARQKAACAAREGNGSGAECAAWHLTPLCTASSLRSKPWASLRNRVTCYSLQWRSKVPLTASHSSGRPLLLSGSVRRTSAAFTWTWICDFERIQGLRSFCLQKTSSSLFLEFVFPAAPRSEPTSDGQPDVSAAAQRQRRRKGHVNVSNGSSPPGHHRVG